MLNPDGVIVGNYRCSLTGVDLNRQWISPSAKQSTEIFAMKEMVRKTIECREVFMFIDMHGHSREKNLFLYGCQSNFVVKPKSTILNNNREKVLPLLM